MSAFVTAGGGFLLAVLWFDLMFDVLALRAPGGEVPEEALASIARYYARVTTAARPMNRLIAGAMLATLAAIAVQLARADTRTWVSVASLALALPPVALAGARIVPQAVRLGTRSGTLSEQRALARTILWGHVYCFASIAALLALQLAFA